MNTDYKVGDLIYDASIYDGLNTFLSDLHFYKKWLSTNKDARILELCCGTGRLTFPIAKDGYNICGVDYTPSMLERAKSRASEEGLKIDFIEADIRTLNLQEKFDFVFIPFNSIHHLYRNEDVFKVLECIRNHLKEGGLFLFDCFNPNIQYIVENEKGQKVIAEYTTDDGREVLIKQTMRYENATQINRIEWHYFINGEFHSIQNMDMRLFFPQELDSYLEQAGFNIIHKFGGFEEEEFSDKSEKQVYVSVMAKGIIKIKPYHGRIPACGVFCGGCPTYIREKRPCKGAELSKARCEKCKTFHLCCIEKKIKHCYQCDIFPCLKFKSFAKRWLKYGQNFIENQNILRQVGEIEFLKIYNNKVHGNY